MRREGERERDKGTRREFHIEHTLDHRIDGIFFFSRERSLFRELHRLDLVEEACHGRSATGSGRASPTVVPSSLEENAHEKITKAITGPREKGENKKGEEEEERREKHAAYF